MALDITDGSSLSREELRRAFSQTHNSYLVLNQVISKNPCFGAYLPAWRRARDAWASFYSKGWSPGRYSAMQRYRLELMRWRRTFFAVCNKQEKDVPLYAAL